MWVQAMYMSLLLDTFRDEEIHIMIVSIMPTFAFFQCFCVKRKKQASGLKCFAQVRFVKAVLVSDVISVGRECVVRISISILDNIYYHKGSLWLEEIRQHPSHITDRREVMVRRSTL